MKKKERVMITTKEIAKIISVTERTVIDLDKNEHLPESIRVGKRMKRWRVKDILDWIAWDCPPRIKFNKLRLYSLKQGTMSYALSGNMFISTKETKETDEEL